MNISGPLPVPSQQRSDESPLMLRLNQRFAAEVVQVAGDRVYLEIDGVQVVAKLTTPDQAAALANRQTANFVVRDLSGQMISLQLASAVADNTTSATSSESDLVANLLNNISVPLTDENISLAQALLKQGIQVTPELIDELRSMLNQAKAAQAKEAGTQGAQATWGQTEAQTAAMLKAAGLPVTAGTLSLAMAEMTPLADAFARLKTKLSDFAKGGLSPGMNSLVQNALARLTGLVVDWGASPSDMAENLRQAITNMGSSLEHELADLVNQGTGSLSDAQAESVMMALAQLRKELARAGPHPLLDEIDRFMDELRMRQFKNAEPFSTPVKEQWLNLDIPLGLPNALSKEYADLQSSPLRVSFHVEDDARKIDMAHSRLVIQVELSAEEMLQVDLSIVAHKMGPGSLLPATTCLKRLKPAFPS